MRYDAAVLTAAAILRALVDVCAMHEEVIDPRWNVLDARRAGLPKEGAHQPRWVRRANRRILREHVEDMMCDAMGLREVSRFGIPSTHCAGMAWSSLGNGCDHHRHHADDTCRVV